MSEIEAEQTRWQEAIYALLSATLGEDASDVIDGAGCDSGDPLDFTLAEISQAMNYFIDERDALKSQLKAWHELADRYGLQKPIGQEAGK